ncbi:hypothetical protein, partial [Proteus mirabilis]
VLASLYESFPVKKSFLVETLFPETSLEPDWSDIPQINHDAIFVTETISWLVEHQYISANIQYGYSFSDVVLTAKGLELLKLTPNSLEPSLGDQLVKAVKSGTKDIIVNVSSSVLTTGIALLNKSLFG